MIEGIAAILETCLTAAKALLERKAQVKTEKQQLALLTTYYCFIGLAATGRQLLDLAGPVPLQTLQRLSQAEFQEFHALAQRLISIQLQRLEKLNAILNDQDVLDLFDPTLRVRIEKAIGDKEEGLYGIGAGLFFYFMLGGKFGKEDSPESELTYLTDIVISMYPEVERGVVAVDAAIAGLNALSETASAYGAIVHQLIPSDKLLALSKDASELARVPNEGA